MARRKKNNRRRRRGSFAALYKLFCFALIVGAIAAAMAVFFKVEHVAVAGNDRYSALEIISASGVRKGNNLFFMNKYDVAGKISGALPYVESVSIHRGLPDTLHVEVQECTCGVALEQEGKTWILCSSGKVVDVVDGSAAESYAAVTGVTLTGLQVGAVAAADEANEALHRTLLEMLQQLRSKGMLSGVQAIHLENSECITVRYLDRFNVELPWDADFDYKFNFLAAVVGKLEDYETGTLRMMTDGEARLIVG